MNCVHPVTLLTSVNTSSAAAADDDASHCDVIVPHPGHLLSIKLVSPQLINPPGTAVPDGLMFYRRCFFLFRHAFSELPQPIALKLCHMVGIWLYFIIPLQKFGGCSPKKVWVPKTWKISVNFGPLQTLIANISGTAEDIRNRPALQTMAIPPALKGKGPVNFGPLTAWNSM